MTGLATCSACPHRSGATCTAPSGSIIFLHASATGCPLNLFPSPQPTQERPQVTGPQLWADLHTGTGWTPEKFAAWLAKVSWLGSCECSASFAQILKLYPPDFSSDDAFFRQSVLWHNLVSVRLSPPKPVMSVEAARRVWGR